MEKKEKESAIFEKDYYRGIRFDILEEIKSEFQHIYIAKNNYLGKFMVIDNQIQFSERDYATYHELMVWPSMILRKGNNIGIYGGGDGLAAAEVLKFKIVPTMVDIDDSVIKLCKKYFSDLNNKSLDKANIVIGDALKFKPKEKLDIIFMDLTDQIECPFLYTTKALKKYRDDLKEDGIILFYGDYTLAKNFYGQIKKHFKYSLAYGALMQSFSTLFTFCMFSNKPLDVEKLKSTTMKGKFFCKEHIWEIDFNRLPQPKLKETFKIIDVSHNFKNC
jgi:spermidine synthase